MDKSKYGVHATHCCISHGCKYSDEDCPVVSGEIKQVYLCEWCDEDNIKSMDELIDSMVDYRSMWNELKDEIDTRINDVENADLVKTFYTNMTSLIEKLENKYRSKF